MILVLCVTAFAGKDSYCSTFRQSGSKAEMAAYFVQEAWYEIDSSSIYSIFDRVSKLKYTLNNESSLLWFLFLNTYWLYEIGTVQWANRQREREQCYVFPGIFPTHAGVSPKCTSFLGGGKEFTRSMMTQNHKQHSCEWGRFLYYVKLHRCCRSDTVLPTEKTRLWIR